MGTKGRRNIKKPKKDKKVKETIIQTEAIKTKTYKGKEV